MKNISLYFIFCFFIISCSSTNKNIEKDKEYIWNETLDAHVMVINDGDSIQKFISFEMDGIKYSIFLCYFPSEAKEPLIINVSGSYSEENELFWLRLVNDTERYIENEILHRGIGFFSLYDKKTKLLNYFSMPDSNYARNWMSVRDENDKLLLIDPEWNLSEDWKIE